ncbi:MAG: dihydrolipoamide acetyltransferase family protein [Bacteroidota bacterium]|nr:dihydrolipoamide acetyltransferase family protein [Bacteroidota bacterium]
MAKIEVIMPQLGESLTEGTIVKWHKKIGDPIKRDETLLEISTDKVDSEIPSPVSGVVTKILFNETDTIAIKTVIAEIETEAGAEVTAEAKPHPLANGPTVDKAEPVMKIEPKQIEKAEKPAAGRFYSPLVLNIAREEGISMAELENIPGTGIGGRVSKKDIMSYFQTRKAVQVVKEEISKPTAPRVETTLKVVDAGDLVAKYPSPKYEILQMSNVIQKMAHHMVNSVATSPHVQAISECDMSNIVKYRDANAAEFEKAEGYKLTYTPFIAAAVIKALKDFPLVNSSVEGDKIIVKKFVNLGMAVASEQGLIVPVIKNADEKNFIGLARAINDLAVRTRSKRLVPADIESASFTFTNYGVFGNIIGIPIINQPNVAILGIGAIKKQPVVISAGGGSAYGGNDAIAIRSISYLTLSFDHRIVDGALGGMFVERVVKYLEEFEYKP